MGNGTLILEPAFPPPPGIVPNFETPSSGANRDTFLVYMGVFYALTVIICAIRAYIKATRSEILLEDWLCILSFTFVTTQLVALIKMWQYGLGLHAWDIEKKSYIEYAKWNYVASGFYIPIVFTTKAAILLLYARIFAVEERVAKSIKVLIWLLFLTLLPVECLKLAVCDPVSANWALSTSPNEQAKHCRSGQQSLFEADITIAIMTDLLIFFIPIPLTISLSFSLRKKIKILLSLLSGSGAVGVAIYKGTLIFNPVGGNDVTGTAAILSILTWIECTTGLCCACVPAVSTLVGKIRKRRSAPPSPHRAREPVFPKEMISTTPTTMSTFDTELALWSGDTQNGHASQSTVEADGRCKSHHSDDGRQQGWLKAQTDPAPATAVLAADTASNSWPRIAWL